MSTAHLAAAPNSKSFQQAFATQEKKQNPQVHCHEPCAWINSGLQPQAVGVHIKAHCLPPVIQDVALQEQIPLQGSPQSLALSHSVAAVLQTIPFGEGCEPACASHRSPGIIPKAASPATPIPPRKLRLDACCIAKILFGNTDAVRYSRR